MKVGVHQGYVLSTLLFAIVMNVVTEDAREGLMHEILYADDLVITSDSIEDCVKNLINEKICWRVRE